MTLIEISLIHFHSLVLHKAFKGELVEQLPTDGDARELLKPDYGFEGSN